MLKFIQINLGSGRGAQNLALQTAAERKADILIISEFYKYERAHERWQCDSSMRAAIAPITNILIDSVGRSDNNGFVWITVAGIRIYSCYWSPNSTPAEYEDFLNRLETSVRASPVAVIVTSMLNTGFGAPQLATVEERHWRTLPRRWVYRFVTRAPS